MSELRRDCFSGGWVVIAPDRRPRIERPAGWPEDEAAGGASCPLCPGNEAKTPPEILAVRPHGSPPDTEGWELRVIPNRIPVFRVEEGLVRRAAGLGDLVSGVGAHEIVIETPDHRARPEELPAARWERLMAAVQARSIDLKRDRRLAYVQIFKNHGIGAGASLAHPHAQVIATPVVPPLVAAEIAAARAHHDRTERCLFCDAIADEAESGARVAARNEAFLLLAPFASRVPFEVHILPLRHAADFDLVAGDERRLLAEMLVTAMRGIARSLGGPAFNLVVHTAPSAAVPRSGRGDLEEEYHWHIELLPRSVRAGGFEWATGIHINSVAPEDAAHRLRENHG